MSARARNWLMWAVLGVGRLVLAGALVGAAVEAVAGRGRRDG